MKEGVLNGIYDVSRSRPDEVGMRLEESSEMYQSRPGSTSRTGLSGIAKEIDSTMEFIFVQRNEIDHMLRNALNPMKLFKMQYPAFAIVQHVR